MSDLKRGDRPGCCDMGNTCIFYELRAANGHWTIDIDGFDSADIIFCPFCGKQLPDNTTAESDFFELPSNQCIVAGNKRYEVVAVYPGSSTAALRLIEDIKPEPKTKEDDIETFKAIVMTNLHRVFDRLKKVEDSAEKSTELEKKIDPKIHIICDSEMPDNSLLLYFGEKDPRNTLVEIGI